MEWNWLRERSRGRQVLADADEVPLGMALGGEKFIERFCKRGKSIFTELFSVRWFCFVGNFEEIERSAVDLFCKKKIILFLGKCRKDIYNYYLL